MCNFPHQTFRGQRLVSTALATRRAAIEDPTMTNTSETAPGILRPPKAAAIAGVLFSVLMIAGIIMIRSAAPEDPSNRTAWLLDPAKRHVLTIVINLIPFAGIAFLWFMAVLRNRLGRLEDQFFATVFLGSGLMFVASLFASAAIAGALLESINAAPGILADNNTFAIIRRAIRAFLNVFAIKMAAVFMFTTCTIALRTSLLPRWIAFLGFTCGLVLLALISNWPWVQLLFPGWMLIVSAQILLSDLHRRLES